MGIGKSFKETEIGTIPQDWDIKKVGELCEFINGKAHERLISENGDYIVVNSKFISTEGEVAKRSMQLLCEAKEKDILMVMSDVPNGKAIAKCFLVKKGNTYTINQRICALRTKTSDSTFLFYKLNRNKFYLSFDDGAKQTNLRKSDVLNCTLATPSSIKEQSAIAEAISDIDNVISNSEKLIAKKRDIKQATMQQLLTGKTRLPGFSGKWEKKELDSICLMKSGESITSANIDQFSEFPCYGGNGLRGFTNRFTHDGHYVLIGRQGALCGNVIGVDGRFFASEHAVVVTTRSQIDPKWLTFVLGQMRLGQYSESSAQPGLSVSKILQLDIEVPHQKAEQQAIATVLDTIDEELRLNEQKLEKLKLLKQGMMQELLTGRIRLI